MSLKQKQGGFTLLELLVVVAILAIIAGAVISAINGQEERAAQGVTLHTMGALENSTRQHQVLFDGIPNNLDTLYCGNVDDAALGIAIDTSGVTPVVQFGGTSDLPFVDGGVTAGLLANLQLVSIPTAAITALNDAGLFQVRIVDSDYCNQTAGEGPNTLDGVVVAAADDAVLAEAVASSMTQTPNESALGRANIVNLGDNTPGGTRLYVHQNPADIGAAEDDIVVVLGIGNRSSLITNELIARAPRDGNAPGVHYGNFSLAFKIGKDINANLTDLSTDVFNDGVSLVAVLDSDGDFFDEETAEFQGLQDE